MSLPELRGDCGKCDALCCVALFLDKSSQFPIDKPAGTPCTLLAGDGRCTIHEARAARGFGGCIAYDCRGAGQYVTQRLFAGRSWRDDPETLGEMSAAFSLVAQIHGLIELLETAGQALELSPAEAARRVELLGRLAPAGGWSLATLSGLRLAEEERQVRAFLASLRAAGLKRRAGLQQSA